MRTRWPSTVRLTAVAHPAPLPPPLPSHPTPDPTHHPDAAFDDHAARFLRMLVNAHHSGHTKGHPPLVIVATGVVPSCRVVGSKAIRRGEGLPTPSPQPTRDAATTNLLRLAFLADALKLATGRGHKGGTGGNGNGNSGRAARAGHTHPALADADERLSIHYITPQLPHKALSELNSGGGGGDAEEPEEPVAHSHSGGYLGDIATILALPRLVELKLLVASLAPDGDTRQPSQGIVPLVKRYAKERLPTEPGSKIKVGFLIETDLGKSFDLLFRNMVRGALRTHPRLRAPPLIYSTLPRPTQLAVENRTEMSRLIISGGDGSNYSNLVIKLDLKPVHALQVRRGVFLCGQTPSVAPSQTSSLDTNPSTPSATKGGLQVERPVVARRDADPPAHGQG